MDSAHRPGPPIEEPRATLLLYDYRRRVADLYSQIRTMDPRAAHRAWVAERSAIFRSHPQSPIPDGHRSTFTGLDVYPYDPDLRFVVPVAPVEPRHLTIGHSGEGSTTATAFGRVTIDAGGTDHHLTLFWLDQYGGGVFVPFRDSTNGSETYGGGRYLLDSAKGADLGSDPEGVVIDFNFAYHPSCVHDSRWSCPLAPPENRLDGAIRAGERL